MDFTSLKGTQLVNIKIINCIFQRWNGDCILLTTGAEAFSAIDMQWQAAHLTPIVYPPGRRGAGANANKDTTLKHIS